MSGEAFVRAQGAEFRGHISKLFLSCGSDMGLRVVERLVWEAVDMCGEVHGPKAVCGMLHKAEMAIHLDTPADLDLASLQNPEEPDPLVLALEGLITVSEQNRRSIAGLADANLAMAGLLGRVINLLEERAAAPGVPE